MLKAIIVDDEEWTRLGLRKQADWEGLGISIADEAKNGVRAMELVKSLLPDIVITDIRMPVMDGIKLMEALSAEFPSILVIVISGYSEFEYAKKAIALQAFDYILKPIESVPLAETLQRAAEKLRKDRAQREQVVYLHIKANESDFISKEKFLTNLVLGRVASAEELASGIRKYGLRMEWQRMAVLVVMAENFEAVAESRYKSDKELTDFVLANVTDELFQSCCNALLFRNYSKHNELIVILELNSLDDQTTMDHIYSSCRQIIATMEQTARFRIIIGIGREFTRLNDVSHSYSQALEAVQNAGIAETSSIVHIDEISSRNSYMMFPDDKEKELLYYMENLYKSQAIDIIEQFFREIGEKSRTVHPQSIRNSVLGLVLSMNKALNKYNMRLEILLQETNITDNLLSGLLTMETLKARLVEMVSKAIDYMSEFKKTGSSKQISDIVQYLHQHYSEDVSLGGVAERFFINPAYLSRMFKNEAGMTFSEYVTRLRMDAAAKMLQDPQLKMIDISEIIGYSSEKYFLKKFKEHFNCTPTEYRNRK